jgi:hypothetical protein
MAKQLRGCWCRKRRQRRNVRFRFSHMMFLVLCRKRPECSGVLERDLFLYSALALFKSTPRTTTHAPKGLSGLREQMNCEMRAAELPVMRRIFDVKTECELTLGPTSSKMPTHLPNDWSVTERPNPSNRVRSVRKQSIFRRFGGASGDGNRFEPSETIRTSHNQLIPVGCWSVYSAH